MTIARFFSLFLLLFSFLGAVLLFSGCSNSDPSELKDRVVQEQEKREVQKAWLSLQHFQEDVYVLRLHNPEQLPLQSLQTKLLYPPHLGSITQYITDETTFPLSIDTQVSQSEGILSVSLAQQGKAVSTDAEMSVVAFKIEQSSQSPFQISFLQPENNTSIMMLSDGEITNVLNLEALNTLIVDQDH